MALPASLCPPLLLLLMAGAATAAPFRLERQVIRGDDPGLTARILGDGGPVYGGLSASLLSDPDYRGAWRLHFGIRPQVGGAALDFRLDHWGDDIGNGDLHSRATLDIEHDFGTRAGIEARLDFQLATSILGTETHAWLDLTETLRFDSRIRSSFDLGAATDPAPVFEVGATRELSEDATFALRYRDGPAVPARIRLSFDLTF